jgi:hypothetical protein
MLPGVIVAIVISSILLAVAVTFGFLAYFRPQTSSINSIIENNKEVTENSKKLSANPYVDLAVPNIVILNPLPANDTRILDLSSFKIYIAREGKLEEEEIAIHPLVPIFVTEEGKFYIEQVYRETQKPSPARIDTNTTLVYDEKAQNLGLSDFDANPGDVLVWKGTSWGAGSLPLGGVLVHSFSSYALQPRVKGTNPIQPQTFTNFTVRTLVGDTVMLLTLRSLGSTVDCILVLRSGPNIYVNRTISGVSTSQTVFLIEENLNILSEAVIEVQIGSSATSTVVVDYFSLSKKVSQSLAKNTQQTIKTFL